MPRPTAEDRRKDYLDIGAEIVTKFSAEDSAAATVDALANVKVADVADRAGVTKGAVYHVWPSQEAYRKDLLARLLEQNRQIGIREMGELLHDADAAVDDPRATLLRHADYVFDALKEDPAFFARFSFFVYASNPEVSELLARGDDGIVEDFGPFIEMYLELIGRRLREPFSVALLMTSIHALFMGLCLRYRTSPELIEPASTTGDDAHSMYAFGLEALLMHFSEPVPDEA
jgi:AcrR family transcriptional regulator